MKESIKLFTSDLSDATKIETLQEHLLAHYKLKLEICNSKEDSEFTAEKPILLLLSDEEIKKFIKKHIEKKPLIGIIPNKLCPKAMRSYGISTDIFEAIDDIFDTSKKRSIDLLFCNDEICFHNIIIGNVHGLNESALAYESLIQRVKSFFSNLFQLSFVDYTLLTAKEQTIHTAATGIMILEHTINSMGNNSISDDLSFHDGKLSAILLAPSSILSYISYILTSFFYYKFSIDKFPKSIGIIQTATLDISSTKPLDFVLDGIGMSAQTINLEVKQNFLTIQLGRLISDEIPETNSQKEDKDVIKVESLPKGEMRQLLLNETVPIFKRAEEEDFKELFVALKQNALLKPPYIVLMVLSTLLATTGLFQSSAPVIIGAMILAPLMGPIISLSMGVVRGEQFLIKESALTLLVGILTALAFSSLYTFLTPLTALTSEMSARVHPNVLDLMVAIISGIAGAYANAKSEIAKSLAGVAIAVALVPPLSVTGIGIGYGDIEMIYGSFLLFTTNLVGITLAAAMTFLVLGYAPIHRATKGIIYTSGFLALVTIPLVISFMILLEQDKIIEQVQTLALDSKSMKINVLSVDLTQKRPTISLEVHSDSIPTKEDLYDLKIKIEQTLHKEILLDVTPKITIK